MAKDIPAKDLKEAVKAMNATLKEIGEKLIKVVGIKKVDVVKELTEKIQDFIDEGNEKDLDDVVIDFYNNYIAESDDSDNSEEETPKEEKKSSKKKEDKKSSPKKNKKKKKSSKKKTETPKEEKKKSKTTKESVLKRNEMINKLIGAGKYTKKQIVEKVSEKFTDVKLITIGTFVQDCMNEKYNKFDKLTIKDSNGILSFKK